MLAQAGLWKTKSLPGEAISCCFFNRVATLAASGGANAASTALPVTPQEHDWERGLMEEPGAGKSEAEAGEPFQAGSCWLCPREWGWGSVDRWLLLAQAASVSHS